MFINFHFISTCFTVVQATAAEGSIEEQVSSSPRQTGSCSKSLITESVKPEFCSKAQDGELFHSAVKALHEKIIWASEALRASSSVEDSIRLCDLIKSSADALSSLIPLQRSS